MRQGLVRDSTQVPIIKHSLLNSCARQSITFLYGFNKSPNGNNVSELPQLVKYNLHSVGSVIRIEKAGPSPTGRVNPFAVQILKDFYEIDASKARSKSWEEFKDVEFDFVITVCDNARETCPTWPGHHCALVHRGIRKTTRKTRQTSTKGGGA